MNERKRMEFLPINLSRGVVLISSIQSYPILFDYFSFPSSSLLVFLGGYSFVSFPSYPTNIR